ncbi:MAG TPA: hypothetical protein PKE37_09415 [Thiomonas arsenitoxydans]|jgi:hypothetical protein|uniref:hypothetical protein n=1 Tax=Thiomonas arsenitoxydans (strain DSM 22701 / CIP 110005 / 3As) TaxID=426114 RepID=UPI002C0540EA|nr:hypothetical protein [Thiomonas arsenitoxydans]HML81969.1 hypothetical protein [Thiomonas arsenitoxydans]
MHHFDLVHMIISSLVHGLIYASVFKLFHHLSLAGAILAAAFGVAAVWLAAKLLQRRG